MSKIITDLDLAKRYTQTYDSAKSRNIEFTLSLKRLRQLLKTENCYYTGQKMDIIPSSPYQLTLDRVDNSIGYTDDNVVACCKNVNGFKGERDIKIFEQIYLGMKKHELKKLNKKQKT